MSIVCKIKHWSQVAFEIGCASFREMDLLGMIGCVFKDQRFTTYVSVFSVEQ
jgi:hypothetical protein